MSVKIVVDSASDIPPDLIEKLDITVVPDIVSVGGNPVKSYKDGELPYSEIYRLQESGHRLSTSAPAPGDFKEAFENLLLSQTTKEIVVVVITASESATFDVALKGRDEVLKTHQDCKIEVIDSKSVAMGTGLLAIFAAEQALAGRSFEEVVSEVKLSVSKIDAMGVLETLKYAITGGRVVARLLDARVLNNRYIQIRPVLTFKDGKLQSGATIRAVKKDSKLIEFILSHHDIRDVAVEYADDSEREDAESLVEEIKKHLKARLQKDELKIRFLVSQISAVLGVHAARNARVVALRME